MKSNQRIVTLKSSMSIIRFDARPDGEGWTIYDRTTDEPALVEDEQIVGLPRREAEQIADTVPARALSVTEAPRDDYVDQSGDVDWYEHASVSLVLADELPEELRSAVRHEHGLDGAVLTLGPMPRALLRYAIGTHTDRRYEGWQAAVWSPEKSQRSWESGAALNRVRVPKR
jgi:hypothetical protein